MNLDDNDTISKVSKKVPLNDPISIDSSQESFLADVPKQKPKRRAYVKFNLEI